MFDLRIDGPVGRLSLVRPEARNAIPLAGWGEMAAAAERAAGEGARALILSGEAGGVFCAGADVSDFDRFQDDAKARTEFRLAIRSGLDRLAALPIPTIALVEGACYGAGVAVAMACDIRVAGPGARFAITPAKLGIAYPQQGVHRLVSLVGAGQAARLLFTAGSIDGAEAARIGLAELHADPPEAAALELATTMAANDADSLSILKRAVRLATSGVSQDDRQDRAFDDLLGSEALAQRLRAHRERRK